MLSDGIVYYIILKGSIAVKRKKKGVWGGGNEVFFPFLFLRTRMIKRRVNRPDHSQLVDFVPNSTGL